MGTVIWALIIGAVLFVGGLPVGPGLGILAGWFIYSGIKACYEDRAYRDMIFLYIVLYFVPGIILLVLAFRAGNNGLIELLFG